MTRLLMLPLILIFFSISQVGKTQQVFISPNVMIGYTFSGGLTYGFSLGLGVQTKEVFMKSPFSYGFSYDKYWFKTTKRKRETHRLTSYGIFGRNNFASFKTGFGNAKVRWGYGQKNQCKITGTFYDLGFTDPGMELTWARFRSFRFNSDRWYWRPGNYNTLYLDYDVLTPLKQHRISD
jgi:hypothetical protein